MMSTVGQIEQPSIAEQIMRLFPASQRAHATYNPDTATQQRRDRDGKLEVHYRTVRKPVTPDLWDRHIAGKYPLVLAMACDDGTSSVSVVDVDQYDLDVIGIVLTIKSRRLPFYVRRSKSGGAHVYAFHEEPIPVAVATAVAQGMARCLGLTKVEYFPKPPSLDPTVLKKPLNMPYFGGAGGFIRPGSKVGDQMRPEEFLPRVVRLSAEHRAQLARLASPRTERVLKPGLVAMMRAHSGAGVSLLPEDNPPIYPPESAEEIELKIRVALSAIASDDYEIWYRIGAAIYAALGDAGYQVFQDWSRESLKYDPRECALKWRHCANIRSIRVETIFWHADQQDPTWRDLYRTLVGRSGRDE
jgi:hypothetical protein